MTGLPIIICGFISMNSFICIFLNKFESLSHFNHTKLVVNRLIGKISLNFSD